MKKILKNFVVNIFTMIQYILPDKLYLKIRYYKLMKKKLNFKKIKSFNEKLQWLKIYDHNPDYTKMVDKYLAKEYVSEIIGQEYIIPTLGVYDKFEDINFDKLPNRFVIKCNHNSGGVMVVNNKENINFNIEKKKFNTLLKKNYYYHSREWPYKNVCPKIIVEENISISDEPINDYKLMCFNGKVKCSFVCSNRNTKNGLNVNFYDEKWNPMPFERHYKKNPIEIPKPANYELMVKLAEKIAQNIPFVRIDFYEVNNKVYFGEITFYPGGGTEEFTPEEWDFKIGEWIDLNIVKRR